jgi:hypothetical protein
LQLGVASNNIVANALACPIFKIPIAVAQITDVVSVWLTANWLGAGRQSWAVEQAIAKYINIWRRDAFKAIAKWA